jgi:hypothetical protein
LLDKNEGEKMSLKINTPRGRCYIDETEVDYQVVVSYPNLVMTDLNDVNEYFEKLGKYEIILKGENQYLNSLGLSNYDKIPEVTKDDIIISSIDLSQEIKRRGNLDIFIQTKLLNKFKQRMYSRERFVLKPENIKEMIEDIEKYDALKKSRMILEKIKDND